MKSLIYSGLEPRFKAVGHLYTGVIEDGQNKSVIAKEAIFQRVKGADNCNISIWQSDMPEGYVLMGFRADSTDNYFSEIRAVKTK